MERFLNTYYYYKYPRTPRKKLHNLILSIGKKFLSVSLQAKMHINKTNTRRKLITMEIIRC